MAGQDSTELVVASHGDIYVAPIGTPKPDAVDDALDTAFQSLGLVTEDGVTITVTPEIESFMAWQRRQAVRRELVNQEIQAAFTLEQWNAENVILAFQGGTVVDLGGGEYRFDAPGGDDALDERIMVIDWQDGPNSLHRMLFHRGNVMEAVEFQLVRNALAVLPITFGILAPDEGDGSPFSYWTSDAAFHS